jgi:hypothetical protein
MQLSQQQNALKLQQAQQANQSKLQTAGIQDQIERQKMWRMEQQSAIDFEQNARGASGTRGKNG